MNMFENNVDPGIALIRNRLSEPIVTCDMQLVISLCNMFECFIFDLHAGYIKNHAKAKEVERYIVFVFVYSYVWSMAITVKDEHCARFDDFIKN